MYLTREEEHTYKGEQGWATQVCMKILVRLGELFGATRLIPIESAHVSGVSYKTLGDAPIDFLQAMTSEGAKARVSATLNPQSFDPSYLCTRLPADVCKKQAKILELFEKMNFRESLTCTPYHLVEPRKGSHLSWAESSAVVYANSVLGAWTNREGGPSALAAAITGKTPDYGVHLAANRQPKVKVVIKAALKDEVDFGALGILLGERLGNKIPSVRGIEKGSRDHLKQFSAALASTGMVNMFQWQNKKTKATEMERIGVEQRDVRDTMESLTTSATERPDLVFLGCPHCSADEVKEIAGLIGNRKVKSGIELWVCTSCHVKQQTRRYVERIEDSGAHVITDTCAVVTWTEKLGIKTIMTNSAKTAHYAPTMNKAETVFAPLKQCLDTGLRG